jgi:hypothetical protein
VSGWTIYLVLVGVISHRGINVDHGINVHQYSKPRNKCKYSILYLYFFYVFDCWSTLVPRWDFQKRGNDYYSSLYPRFTCERVLSWTLNPYNTLNNWYRMMNKKNHTITYFNFSYIQSLFFRIIYLILMALLAESVLFLLRMIK